MGKTAPAPDPIKTALIQAARDDGQKIKIKFRRCKKGSYHFFIVNLGQKDPSRRGTIHEGCGNNAKGDPCEFHMKPTIVQLDPAKLQRILDAHPPPPDPPSPPRTTGTGNSPHASLGTSQPLELATVSKPTPESAVARQLEIEELLKKGGLSASQLQVLNDEHHALGVHLAECNNGESNTDQFPTSSPTSSAPGPSHTNTGSSPNSEAAWMRRAQIAYSLQWDSSLSAAEIANLEKERAALDILLADIQGRKSRSPQHKSLLKRKYSGSSTTSRTSSTSPLKSSRATSSSTPVRTPVQSVLADLDEKYGYWNGNAESAGPSKRARTEREPIPSLASRLNGKLPIHGKSVKGKEKAVARTVCTAYIVRKNGPIEFLDVGDKICLDYDDVIEVESEAE